MPLAQLTPRWSHAAGGRQGGHEAFGGRGGQVTAIVPVIPGQLLQVNVGGKGGPNAAGFNGGGGVEFSGGFGGGGASDVRVDGVLLDDRVAVAGGGGGAGANASAACGAGGSGGGLAGEPGESCPSDLEWAPVEGGGGGGPGAGGFAGNGFGLFAGRPGGRGFGGWAGFGDRPGGGGGGGYFGGGGGAGCHTCVPGGGTGAGGGGGSSWADPARVLSATTTPGVNVGHGSVTISWPPPVDVEATFGFDSYGEYRNGVHIGSGNFVDTTTDVEIATVGPDLKLERTYNSLDPRVGLFGRGWSTPYEARIEDGVGVATVVYGDGRRERHSRQPDGTYTPPLGFVSRLEAAAGGGWRLVHKDKSVHTFGADGRLTRVADRYGRALVLVHDAAGDLDRVTDAASGRYLDFEVVGGRAVSVATNSVSGPGYDGPLAWRFAYAGELLTSACDARDNTGNCTTYTYTAGRLTRITRPEGNDARRLAYRAGTGKVEWSENGAGDRVSFTYGGGVTQITDGRGKPTSYFFDHLFRTTRVAEVDGSATVYEYDANGFRSAVVDANGNRVTMSYDARGNLLAQTNAEGETTWFEYVRDDRVAMRDGRSAGPHDNTFKTTYTYNAQGDVLTVTSPPTPDHPAGVTATTTYTNGTENFGWGVVPPGLVRSQSPGRGTTWFEYDAAGSVRRRYDPSGQQTVYAYDALGRPTFELVVWTGGIALSTTAYDQAGNVVSETAPAVQDTAVSPAVTRRRTTTHQYDRNGNRTRTTVADTGGSANPTPARVTAYVYDAADRLVSTTDPEGGVTRREFDANGNVTRVVDAEGRVIETLYDARDRRIELRVRDFVDDPIAGSTPRTMVLGRWSYNAAGRVVVEARPQPGTGGRPGQATPSVPMSETRTAYDRADRPVSVTLAGFDNRAGVTPAARDVVLAAYTYDDAGNRVTETVGGGLRTTTYTYDAANRVQSASTPVDGTTRLVEYDYDALGNVTRTTVSAGGTVASETRAGYDDAGRLTAQIVENGAQDLVTTYTYDERGLQTSVVDPRGNLPGANAASYRTDMTYTPAGLLETVTGPPIPAEEDGGPSTTVRPVTRYGYDAVGNRTTVVDPRGARTHTTYDRLDRPTRIDHPAYTPPGSSPIVPFETFTYDRVGNLVARRDRRGYVTDFTYDALNRTVRRLDPAAGGARGATLYEYDDAGNQVATIGPTGARTNFSYDDMGRIRTRTDVVRQAAPAGSFTTIYDYDDLGNLTFTQDPTGVVTRATYNAAAERTSIVDARNAATTFTYDAAGRLVSETDASGRSRVSIYDLAGRAVATEHRSGGPGGALLASEHASYDAAGNLTIVRSARSVSATDVTYLRLFSYDAANPLQSVLEPDSASGWFVTTYGYDATGNLTRVGAGATATYHGYNAWGCGPRRSSRRRPGRPPRPTARSRRSTTRAACRSRNASRVRRSPGRSTRSVGWSASTAAVAGSLRRRAVSRSTPRAGWCRWIMRPVRSRSRTTTVA